MTGLRSLVVAADLPVPVSSGLDLRTLCVVEALARLGPVGVFGVYPRTREPSPIAELAAWRSSSDLTLADPAAQARAELSWLNTPDGQPGDRWWSDHAAAELAQLADELQPDVVVVEQLWVYRYGEAIRAPGRRLVLNAHNAEAKLQEDLARSTGTGRRRMPAPIARRLVERVTLREAAAVASADQTWAPSDHDAAVLARSHPRGVAGIAVVPSGIRTDAYSRERDADEDVMLYPGSFTYPPNEHAARRLVAGVLPAVRDSVPAARLLLVGAGLPADLASAVGVEAPGHVPEMLPYLHRASVMPVALSEGGGTRLKVLEAFAAGVAVVSTRKGVEGLAVRDGVHVVLADSDAELAAGVLRLWEDDRLRARLVEEAATLVRDRYSLDAVTAAVRRALGAEC